MDTVSAAGALGIVSNADVDESGGIPCTKENAHCILMGHMTSQQRVFIVLPCSEEKKDVGYRQK